MMNPTPAVSKPIPEQDESSAPFWEGTLKGKLMLMKCSSCGTCRLPSRLHCDECLSTDSTWVEASGRGRVHTFAVMYQKYHPGWTPEIPYNITIVELEEGPRFPTNVVGIANEEIRVGMPVVVDWEKHEDVALPKFRPA